MSDKNDNLKIEEVKETTAEPVEFTVEAVEEVEPIENTEEVIVEENLPEEVETIKLNSLDFSVGDTIKVFYKIVEGDKFRIQPYEGIVIAINGKGNSKTFTVRRIGAGQVGIERIFPLQSPNIEKITISKYGKVRRAKLYYLREKIGKAATKIKERKLKVS